MSDLLQIKRTIIEAGFKKEYKLFQISDIHMSCIDEHSSEIDIKEQKRFHAQWDTLKVQFANEAHEMCDERYDIEPNVIFEELMSHAISFGANAVIFSGDMMDRVNETNLRYLRDFFSRYPIPVIYCPGNHCWINENGEMINQYDRLSSIIKNPAFDSFDLGDFQIITIDNSTKNITGEQLSFFEEKLKEDKRILLVVHAPLNMGSFGKELSKKISPYFLLGVNGDCENAFEFNQLVRDNEKRLIAVLAGHIHFFYEDKITERLMQYTTSSGLIGSGREIIIR